MAEYTIAPICNWSLENDRVVIATREGRAFTLNRVGSSIWQCIAEPVSTERIVDELAKQYAVPDTVKLSEDVDAFLSRLEAQQLIIRTPA